MGHIDLQDKDNIMTSAARIARSGSKKHTAPVTVIPEVRTPDFDFADDVPKYWWGNDPARTLLLAALSASFPAGQSASSEVITGPGEMAPTRMPCLKTWRRTVCTKQLTAHLDDA